MSEIINLLLQLSDEIKYIKAYLEVYRKTRLERFNEAWIDGQDIMQTLHISKRTLQTWRDSKIIPYSQIKGKFYYKLSDIESILEKNHSNYKNPGSHEN
jgi:hypothetical protein